MNFNDFIDWLFTGTVGKPQLGFAGEDKRAWCWLPGRKTTTTETISRSMEYAPLRGCSQVSYESWWEPMAGQKCWIHWVGLDIDAEDNPDGIDLQLILKTNPSMIRYSVSGKGIHVIYRLKEPVLCTHETANKIIKRITKPLVEAVAPIHVCKSDKRMFWFFGGKNVMVEMTDAVLDPCISDLEIATLEPQEVRQDFEVTPKVREWLEKLGIKSIHKSIPIYVGDMVNLLREAGENVTTKSSCRGNGQLNGYLDLTPTSISLFAYADGHSIWGYTDVEALLS